MLRLSRAQFARPSAVILGHPRPNGEYKMKLRFFGGVDTVTGSAHAVEVNGKQVLRDCGLYQGRRAEANRRNRSFAFDPQDLAAVVLSHAHIDHCGNLPSLAKAGYRGPIHTTTATVALCDVMLHDAAYIQEQDAAYLNQKTNRRGLPPIEPLYTAADADRVLKLLRGYHYGEGIEVVPGARLALLEAGHILGAALTVFDLEENGRRVRLGFAFDLGRHGLPLIRDPAPMRDIDTLVIESTYGSRRHPAPAEAGAQLRDVVRRTIERGGKVLIPSFALERAQEVLYHLARLTADGEIEETPVYVDSPMASAVTRIFERSTPYLDEEFHALRERIGRVITPSWVHFTASVEESKQITASDRPCIVIAASGMCEYGRILHHLKHGITNPRNTIVLVGFQAAHTLGRRLYDGDPEVRIFGDLFERKAEVVSLPAFSAHADREDLATYVQDAAPRRVFLVHGESEARSALAERLREIKGLEVFLPEPGDEVEL